MFAVMKHGSLFSGIGGAELAATWVGWQNVFHCEINPFGRKVLDYYWPESKSYDDITKTDFTIWRGRVDILTGGFPCQPFSMAGKRKGTEDDRHLWPEMLRAIREVQPTWVVGENVFGLVNWNGGLVFESVQTDLETEGYEVVPFILPACAVGAPHRRDRVWIVAHSIGSGHGRRTETTGSDQSERFGRMDEDGRRNGCEIRGEVERCGEVAQNPVFCGFLHGESKQEGTEIREQRDVGTGDSEWIHIQQGFTSDPCNQGLQGCEDNGSTGGSGEERNEQFTRFFRTDWSDFPTQSPVCNRNDGLSDRLAGITFSRWRKESIKAMGNSWVPQVAYQIFKAINEYDKS